MPISVSSHCCTESDVMTIDLEKFTGCRILVVGDLMLDEYLWGDVERISPEAPVQVVSVVNADHTLGGAGNVISNLVALGAKVSAVGVIGSGSNGQRLLKELNALGVHTQAVIQEAAKPSMKRLVAVTLPFISKGSNHLRL